jgi:hypothetical protein
LENLLNSEKGTYLAFGPIEITEVDLCSVERFQRIKNNSLTDLQFCEKTFCETNAKEYSLSEYVV